MKKLIQLGGRGLRYIRKYGLARLYCKVIERKRRNQAEEGYDAWLAAQLPDGETERRQKETRFPYEPCISILVPAYETPETFLRQMIESVLSQSYGKLELCIADGSPSDKVERVVREYEEQDGRIRYRHLAENLGISDNTNAALALASGDYVGLLDHDDLLLPGALFEILMGTQRERRGGRGLYG
ncbi:MAG: glycosyltransferase [Eubacteriales bacterium]